MRDLSAGNPSLAGRRLNLYLNLAKAYAVQDQPSNALGYLQKAALEAHIPGVADYCEHEKAFEKIRDTPDFRKAMTEFRRYRSLWESPAINTAYRENISDAEKIAGLSKFWSEVKYNFGFPEKLMTLDWDRLYLEWIPRVIASKSTAAYYRELMLLCARLGDGHTNIYSPDKAGQNAKPPLRTALVDGHVLILDVRSPALEAQGLHAGMEITAVDGEAVRTYAQRDVEPFLSASTPQDRDLRTYWYEFLRGPAAKPVRLSLRDAAGNQTEVEARRGGYKDIRNIPPFEWRMLEGNIAYVALNSFGSDRTVTLWRAAFPEISKASAIVLDVRTNGGGSSEIGYEILRDLTSSPFLGSRQRIRKYSPTDRARGSSIDFIELPADSIEPRVGGYTSRPVVVLSGAATYSAAEDFLVAWKSSNRGKIIGEPSGGSTGQPLFFTLPGGGTARICTKKDMFADGTEWVGKGIEPDIPVKPSMADVQAGKDTVLTRALQYVVSVSRR